MGRPALSGSRATQVLNLMAATPERAFSLSELVRETDTNFASCHAVLSVLVDQAYLTRSDVQKTYRLGPVLYAIGQAMASTDARLPVLLAASESLAVRMGLEVAVSVRAADELVGLSRHGQAPRPGYGLRVGQRAPLAPPIGATLIAWSDDAEVEAWIDRGQKAGGLLDAASLRSELAAIRSRGYLATLDTHSYAEISSETVRRRREGPLASKAASMAALYGALAQPEVVTATAAYDLAYIGAPIFDLAGHASYSVVLSGFAGPVSGGDLDRYAAELTRMCTGVARAASIK